MQRLWQEDCVVSKHSDALGVFPISCFPISFIEMYNQLINYIGKPQEHTKLTDCAASSLCAANVSAVATYCNNPPMFKLEFSVIDGLSGQPEAFCPISRKDIRWVEDDWVQELRQSLRTKVIAKIHKYNKHLAIWQARRLIVEWAKGSLSLGDDVSKMGFLERETADVATVGLGGTIENK